jgi:hypothetical protein
MVVVVVGGGDVEISGAGACTQHRPVRRRPTHRNRLYRPGSAFFPTITGIGVILAAPAASISASIHLGLSHHRSKSKMSYDNQRGGGSGCCGGGDSLLRLGSVCGLKCVELRPG